MSKSLGSEWKWYKVYKELASPYPCYPVNYEYSWKKTQIEKQKKTNSALELVRITIRSMMSEERRNSFMTEVPIIYFIVGIC